MLARRGARITENEFKGKGYAGVVGVTSEGWRVRENDFCHLVVPPSATADAGLGLPNNEARTPIVFLDSTDMKAVDNDCD